mmetsp:Transcript_29926/g.55023  ORF Transcript_29926/g.55023 Transcript_29926/m.55023 type:complete len:214 (-) Transcript_29926:436-1077(-)
MASAVPLFAYASMSKVYCKLPGRYSSLSSSLAIFSSVAIISSAFAKALGSLALTSSLTSCVFQYFFRLALRANALSLVELSASSLSSSSGGRMLLDSSSRSDSRDSSSSSMSSKMSSKMSIRVDSLLLSATGEEFESSISSTIGTSLIVSAFSLSSSSISAALNLSIRSAFRPAKGSPNSLRRSFKIGTVNNCNSVDCGSFTLGGSGTSSAPI